MIGVYYSFWLVLYYFWLLFFIGGLEGVKLDKLFILVVLIGVYMDSFKVLIYFVSKFGVWGLFRSMCVWMLDIGVRCNLLVLWFVDMLFVVLIKNVMVVRGVDMVRVLDFVSVEVCVEVVSYCVVDGGVYGMCFVFKFEGNYVDLEM